MKVKKIDGKWWVVDIPEEYECEPIGPYDTKVEAEEAAVGLERFEEEFAKIACPTCQGTGKEETLPGKFRVCPDCFGERVAP